MTVEYLIIVALTVGKMLSERVQRFELFTKCDIMGNTRDNEIWYLRLLCFRIINKKSQLYVTI